MVNELKECYKWPMEQHDVEKLLGLKKNVLNQKIKRLREKGEFIEGENEDYFKDSSKKRPRSPHPYRMITKRGAIKIAKHSIKPKATDFLVKIDHITRPRSRIETDCIGIIMKSINGFTAYETEYYVEFDKRYYGYRIDLYLKDLNIAIECDEMGHKERDKFDEEDRENKIKEILGCKFIRFNPDETNFNIGDYINQIFSEIMNKKG